MLSVRNLSWGVLGVALVAVVCLSLPAAFGAEGGKASSLSKQDQGFVNKAWNINTAEIRLGEMAQNKAANADVKAFGHAMVTDHTRLNRELTALVDQHGGTLPKELDKHHRNLADKLSKLSGADFDREYMDAMVKGHRDAVTTFEKESKDSPQTDVDKWAGDTVATLKGHLKMAEKTGKEVGAKAAAERTHERTPAGAPAK